MRFPIIPRIEPLPADYQLPPERRGRIRRLMLRTAAAPLGIYRMISPSFVTPRDFDLSPYFDIIKFNLIADARFDYHQIKWASDEGEELPDL